MSVLRRHVWWIAGLATVGLGVAIVVSAQTGSADFGWYAYTPLETGPDFSAGGPDWFVTWDQGDLFFLSRRAVAGLALTVIGLLLLTGLLGYRLGKRGSAPVQSGQ